MRDKETISRNITVILRRIWEMYEWKRGKERLVITQSLRHLLNFIYNVNTLTLYITPFYLNK